MPLGALAGDSGVTVTRPKREKSMGRPVVHFEIGCRDRARTGDFYSKLFGWQITPPAPRRLFKPEVRRASRVTSLRSAEHYTMFYVDVEDVKAALDNAAELGGKALVGPITIPAGTFAWFADPDGNTIGLLKSAKP